MPQTQDPQAVIRVEIEGVGTFYVPADVPPDQIQAAGELIRQGGEPPAFFLKPGEAASERTAADPFEGVSGPAFLKGMGGLGLSAMKYLLPLLTRGMSLPAQVGAQGLAGTTEEIGRQAMEGEAPDVSRVLSEGGQQAGLQALVGLLDPAARATMSAGRTAYRTGFRFNPRDVQIPAIGSAERLADIGLEQGALQVPPTTGKPFVNIGATRSAGAEMAEQVRRGVPPVKPGQRSVGPTQESILQMTGRGRQPMTPKGEPIEWASGMPAAERKVMGRLQRVESLSRQPAFMGSGIAPELGNLSQQAQQRLILARGMLYASSPTGIGATAVGLQAAPGMFNKTLAGVLPHIVNNPETRRRFGVFMARQTGRLQAGGTKLSAGTLLRLIEDYLDEELGPEGGRE